VDASDLAFAGAAAQAQMLADGELSAPELLEIYLERIARLDSQLRAFRVVLADKARDEAYAAQDRLDAGERPPLPHVVTSPATSTSSLIAIGTPSSGSRSPASRRSCAA
jgi:amidase